MKAKWQRHGRRSSGSRTGRQERKERKAGRDDGRNDSTFLREPHRELRLETEARWEWAERRSRGMVWNGGIKKEEGEDASR